MGVEIPKKIASEKTAEIKEKTKNFAEIKEKTKTFAMELLDENNKICKKSGKRNGSKPRILLSLSHLPSLEDTFENDVQTSNKMKRKRSESDEQSNEEQKNGDIKKY